MASGATALCLGLRLSHSTCHWDVNCQQTHMTHPVMGDEGGSPPLHSSTVVIFEALVCSLMGQGGCLLLFFFADAAFLCLADSEAFSFFIPLRHSECVPRGSEGSDGTANAINKNRGFLRHSGCIKHMETVRRGLKNVSITHLKHRKQRHQNVFSLT